ncbi:MAG: helicase RecQ [Burkholderiales bacterium]|jgi:RecQ family ATP-dependent DNA helicase|nr:helicase RecQ [Burkholderiales bacterium]
MNIQATSLLKQYFGYDSFRPMQAQIIQSVLDKKDTVVLMPTGGGKSICFQIPALILPGLCIVVSPLISLMKDQVDALNANGIAAEFLNSSLDFHTQNVIIDKCSNNKVKILYISPERVNKDIENLLKYLPVSLFAIDEAHCVSSWGHDFRPEYTKLASLKANFPKIPLIALTATANLQTRADIIKQLNLVSPEVFVASFDRPNLSITVKLEVKPKERTREIINFVKTREEETGIIYCLSRSSCDKLVQSLQLSGINAASYHAGLSAGERHRVQENFIQDKIQVICATIAFGMGIDKSNVRYVIHFNVPKSIEGYYQEIGRAGRDGVASDTVMYFSYADFKILSSFAMESNQSQLNLDKLKQVQNFARTDKCRRKILLTYFGETPISDCGNCDVCNPQEVIKISKSLQPDSISSGKNKHTGNYSKEVFEGLRKLRRQIADAKNLPAYIVFSDATLKEMAEKCPHTSQQMLSISGVGQYKLVQYGQQFLDFFLDLNNFAGVNRHNWSAPEKPKKIASANTYVETLSLYKAGLTVDQIAVKRNLNVNTIYSHIELLYSTDKITSLDSFISADEVKHLRLVLPELAEAPSLKQIFEALNGNLEYYKIKLILAYLKKNSTTSGHFTSK